MLLIKPSFEILEQESDIQGIYKQIEKAGRTCYKSENLITEDSAEKFVNMIKDRNHTAMLEHGTVYLTFEGLGEAYTTLVSKYKSNKYSLVNEYRNYFCRGINDEPYTNRSFVTTNYRVLYENNWLEDLKYLCKPTNYHEKRITVKFLCDRGISHEFVRHRVFSFAQESTRYCNYSKDKFGNSISYIIPSWLSLEEGNYSILEDNGILDTPIGVFPFTEVDQSTLFFIAGLSEAEVRYFELLHSEWTPQQARSVLPNSLKTELVMTGTIEQWKGFFKLRCDKAAHPQARELAIPLEKEFKRRNYA